MDCDFHMKGWRKETLSTVTKQQVGHPVFILEFSYTVSKPINFSISRYYRHFG